MALVLSHMRGTLSNLTPKSLIVCAVSKECANNSYILGLGGGLCNWRLFLKRPANERISKKMTSVRSALSVNPSTRKISIGKTNKI
jgi:hypothetical protein